MKSNTPEAIACIHTPPTTYVCEKHVSTKRLVSSSDTTHKGKGASKSDHAGDMHVRVLTYTNNLLGFRDENRTTNQKRACDTHVGQISI